MLRAYKYRLYPTEEQKVLFAKTFGCCRFVYNWGLKKKKEAYEKEKKSVSRFDLQKELSHELKKEHEWLKEVNSQALISSLINLEAAYSKFFSNPGVIGYPRFKNKHEHQSFQCEQFSSVDFENSTISIIKAKYIPAVLHRKFTGKVKTVTISMTPSGKYYASVLVENDEKELPVSTLDKEKTIGIDVGVKTLAVCSNGVEFDNPKNLQHSLKRLKMYQRRLSRKVKDSANRNRARIKVAKLHEKITNQRKDNIHKATYALTHDSQVRTICVEDLNVKGMTRNHHLAQSISDASFGTFLSVLEYKCKWYGVNFVRIGRFEPSSQTCSVCGYQNKKLKLKDREWTCESCGTHHDRDKNAAINIRNIGLTTLPSERGKVKSVDCPTVDDRRISVLKSSGRKKQKKTL